MAKTAVILMNLGGPDKKESIRPFLINFFMDKNIIRLPYPFRYLIARMIANKRTKKEAGESYGELGDRSPLLDNTVAQAESLKKTLGDDYSVHIHMRYWHPMADEVAIKLAEEKPEKIILMPLYPQYSTTTTRSSLQELEKAFPKHGIQADIVTVCCYPFDEGFIEASANNVKTIYDEMPTNPRVLFSAHGLPKTVIKDGDSYEWQCQESARLIADKTGIENMDWQICYQSKVGPMEWLGPSTEEALHQAAKDGKDVLIYPHAFVSEHVETLVELDIEYKEVADELGIKNYRRVPTVGVDQLFIDGLAGIIRKYTEVKSGVFSDKGERLCPTTFRRCAMDKCSGLKGFGQNARLAA